MLHSLLTNSNGKKNGNLQKKKKVISVENELIELVRHCNVSCTTLEAGMWMILTLSNIGHFLEVPFCFCSVPFVS